MKISKGLPKLCGILLLLLSPALLGAAGGRTPESDRAALMALEKAWLDARDPAVLAPILAADFVHPVPSGDFLTRQQHLDWLAHHPPPADLQRKLDGMTVRFYGDTGIVTGTVVTSGPAGVEVRRSVFTDVFVFRDGRWQAVNAQENVVEGRPPA
ncbi:MAG: nuclear transport factor 2 family protein [Thermoanaerobaculia bacterium]